MGDKAAGKSRRGSFLPGLLRKSLKGCRLLWCSLPHSPRTLSLPGERFQPRAKSPQADLCPRPQEDKTSREELQVGGEVPRLRTPQPCPYGA